MEKLASESVKITALLVISAATVLVLMHKEHFAYGLLSGAAWGIVNFLSLIGLLRIALLKAPKGRLILILLVKFPLLYLIGLLILVSHIFPVASLLIGLTSILLVVGVLKICPKPV